MLMKEIQVKQKDDYVTLLYPYFCDGTPKASVLILHGMAEYHERYTEFAEFLNKRGYDVYLYDHRGHGRDKKLEDLGYFAPKKGYEVITFDALNVLNFIRKNGRSKKLVLFGHSMGSLVARNVIQYDDTMDCAVICGTNHMARPVVKAGKFVAGIIKLFNGPAHPSPFMNKLMFTSKYYTKLCERTSFDWLTRNNYIVGQYIGDAYCGFLCTVSMYSDITHLVDNASNLAKVNRTRKDLPLMVISGDKDPVGSYGKDVITFVNMLQKQGFTKVDCSLYKECRHELLNELNNKEIMTDVADWIDARLSGEAEQPAKETEEVSE